MINTILTQPLLILILTLTGTLTLIVVVPSEISSNGLVQKQIALFGSLVALLVGVIACFSFDQSTVGFQFLYRLNLLSAYNLSLSLGVDGLGFIFTLLTLFIFPICILAS